MLKLKLEEELQLISLITRVENGIDCFPAKIGTIDISNLNDFISYVVKNESTYEMFKDRLQKSNSIEIVNQLEEAKSMHDNVVKQSKAESLKQKFSEALKKARGL